MKLANVDIGNDEKKNPMSWHSWSRTAQFFSVVYLMTMIAVLHTYSVGEWIGRIPYDPRFWTTLAAFLLPVSLALSVAIVFARHLTRRQTDDKPPQPEKGFSLGLVWQHFHWLLSGLFLFGVWSGLYFLTAQFIPAFPSSTLYSTLDHWIPFRSEAVFVYLTAYWIFLIGAFGVKTPDDSWRFIKGGLLICSISSLCHYFIPVALSRPELTGATFSEWALGLVYAGDNPTNCFPSMHCAMSLFGALHIWKRNRNAGFIAFALVVEIGISTMLVRQHFFCDTIAGYAIAVFAYHAAAISSTRVFHVYKAFRRQWLDGFQEIRNVFK